MNIETLIETEDKFGDEAAFKNVIVTPCLINDEDKSYPQLFLEKVLVA